MRITLILLTISTITFGQRDNQVDSLINVMCKSLKTDQQLTDSTKLILVYGHHLFPFVEKYEENQREQIFENIYYRFQRNCRDFSDLLDRLEPPNEYWEKVLDKPKSKLTKKGCYDFLKHKTYNYSEVNGDTVRLTIENGLWTDHFKDGTYSRLKFKWTTDCDFEIEFIDSNNSIRSQFSKRGDKYVYQVVDKTDHYYVLSVQVTGTEGYYLFHMRY